MVTKSCPTLVTPRATARQAPPCMEFPGKNTRALIKRLFSSSSLSAIRVLSSAYLRLLVFLLPILILGCNSSSLDAIKVSIMSANLEDPAVAILVCIPTNSVRGLPFLHTLSSKINKYLNIKKNSMSPWKGGVACGCQGCVAE